MKTSKDIRNYLNKVVKEFKMILAGNLVGIYLHGSLAMDCYNPKSSDIDLLIVIKKRLDLKTRRELLKFLVGLPQRYKIELSVVLRKDINNFKYRTPFQLHYANEYRQNVLEDPNYLCGPDKDTDLPAHFMMTLHRGKKLYGLSIKKVFRPIPKKYFIKSLKSDLDWLKERLDDIPVYCILNICRAICYLREEKYCSKLEGGEWALNNLDNEFNDLIKRALLVYRGKNNFTRLDKKELRRFIDYAEIEMDKY